MISKQLYLQYKQQVVEYEREEARLAKVKGYSVCPFCGGTKTKPFVRASTNQNCTDCNSNGMISNKSLMTIGLDDSIQKPLKDKSNNLLVSA